MPIPILMPALSPTMEEGTLAKWHVKEGDQVSAGDVIAEIETDKATMEVEAVEDGRVGKLLIGEGTEGVKVNKPIAVLLAEGEGEDALKEFDPAAAAKAPSPEAGETGARQPAGNGADDGSATASTSAAERTEPGKDKTPAADRPPPPTRQEPAPPREEAKPRKSNGAGRIFASPLARRLAEQKGIDLARITGSGPHSRIIKRDIEQAERTGAAGAEETAPAQPAAAEQAPAGRGELVTRAGAATMPPALSDEAILSFYEQGSYELVPHDNMRRIIAQRLTQAKATIPHFYLNVDCEIDALLAARERINALSPKEGANSFKLSVNDFIIKAMAMALQKVPAANATWTERGILRHKSSDVGVAVAIEGGLFTPVIRHAEVKSLSEISNEMRDLAQRARNRRLKPHEYQGGTTAISNLGMYGVKSFDAVINPPHATILAVGMGEKRPVIKGEEIRIATLMSCTLSCDHRVVDGALGAELLAAFKGFIDEPVTMLV